MIAIILLCSILFIMIPILIIGKLFDDNGVHDGKDYDLEQINLIGDKKAFDSRQEAYSAAFDYILKEMV